MTPTQELALTDVVSTQEQLQAKVNKPRVFKLSDLSRLQAHVVTFVGEHADGILVWSTMIRLFHPKKRKYKPIDTWTVLEKFRVEMILGSELAGVGIEGSDENFNSTSIQAAHLTRKLTGSEMAMTVEGRRALLGIEKENGNKAPTVITDKKSAGRLLDKLERELKEKGE